jgi:hypothetical protein
MRYAVIENNIVVNFAESESALESNWILCDETVRIGHTRNADGTYTAPPLNPEVYRAERNRQLQEVDVIAGNALRWGELTAEKQQEWANYRQALLDVPQQAGFPENITWPTKPAE